MNQKVMTMKELVAEAMGGVPAEAKAAPKPEPEFSERVARMRYDAETLSRNSIDPKIAAAAQAALAVLNQQEGGENA